MQERRRKASGLLSMNAKAILLLLPLLAAQGIGVGAGLPIADIANLSLAVALLVALGLGWIVPGPVYNKESDRVDRFAEIAEKSTAVSEKSLTQSEAILSLLQEMRGEQQLARKLEEELRKRQP